jgi:hypothetical protein
LHTYDDQLRSKSVSQSVRLTDRHSANETHTQCESSHSACSSTVRGLLVVVVIVVVIVVGDRGVVSVVVVDVICTMCDQHLLLTFVTVTHHHHHSHYPHPHHHKHHQHHYHHTSCHLGLVKHTETEILPILQPEVQYAFKVLMIH